MKRPFPSWLETAVVYQIYPQSFSDSGSLLQRVRRMIALRRKHRALAALGGFEPLHAEAGSYSFVYPRFAGEETFIIAINPSGRTEEAPLPADAVPREPECPYGRRDALARSGAAWR